MKRKHIILTVLLGLLLLCVVYAYFATPSLEKAPPRKVKEQTAVMKDTVPKSAEVETSELRSISLQHSEAEPFPGAKRDIFQFKARQVKKPLAKVASKPAEKPVIVEPPKPVAPTPFEVVQKSLARFTFLGFLDRDGEKTVFLSSGGELFVVKSGERFGSSQEFLITSIEDKSLIVKNKFDDRILEVPLIENQTLKPSVSAPARRLQSTPLASVPQRRNVGNRKPVSVVQPETYDESSDSTDIFIEPDNEEALQIDQEGENEAREPDVILQGENANGAN
ncbi:MAG: hypothetical protein JRD88_07405 [Deltaproteobacteria bacterium]|jgi:hypothetical protein|nr:hypothetical protein [Deltaproteobacteria bacterium]